MTDNSRVDNLTKLFQGIVSDVEDNCSLSADEVDNVKDSARRIAKAFCEMNLTREDIKAGIEDALSKSFPADSSSNGMIIVSPIDTAGICPHHFLPITYKVMLALKFGDGTELVGLSKYPRVAQIVSKRPVVQEQYTRDLVDVFLSGRIGDMKLSTKVKARGCIAIVQGVHGCMTCRGVRSNANTITIEYMGAIEEHEVDRALSLFNSKGMAQ